MARKQNALAALWGFAEASVFFIVPDVLLSWYALSDVRRALIACLYALVGALVGGALVWSLGRNDPDSIRTLFVSLPGIDEAMLTTVRMQLQEKGLTAVFLGPLQGMPYKMYALEASSVNAPFLLFLLISIPARLTRFVLVTLLVGGLRKLLGRLSLHSVRLTHLFCWTLFYAWYFSAVGTIG